MALKIDATWSQPIGLTDASSENLIYGSDLSDTPTGPGVYVFARIHGNSISPLYIGQAANIKSRLEQQFNNVRLMMGLKQAASGKRVLLVAEVHLKPGQRRDKVLDVLESSLIGHALATGATLLNKAGTKTPAHEIDFRGNVTSRKVAPRRMRVRSR